MVVVEEELILWYQRTVWDGIGCMDRCELKCIWVPTIITTKNRPMVGRKPTKQDGGWYSLGGDQMNTWRLWGDMRAATSTDITNCLVNKQLRKANCSEWLVNNSDRHRVITLIWCITNQPTQHTISENLPPLWQ